MTFPTIGGQNSNDDGQNLPLVTYTLRDHTGETTSMSNYIRQPTAANLPDILVDVGAMREAIQDITLGVTAKERGEFTNTVLDNRAASDPNAQRERKFLVSSIDTTEFLDVVNAVRNPNFQKPHNRELGTARTVDPDGADLLIAGTEQVDLANPYIIAFITQYEEMFVSPAIGDLEVQSITLVGRDL